MTYFAITPNNIVDIPVGFAARLNVAFLAVGRETPFLRAFFLGIMTEGFYGPYGNLRSVAEVAVTLWGKSITLV